MFKVTNSSQHTMCNYNAYIVLLHADSDSIEWYGVLQTTFHALMICKSLMPNSVSRYQLCYSIKNKQAQCLNYGVLNRFDCGIVTHVIIEAFFGFICFSSETFADKAVVRYAEVLLPLNLCPYVLYYALGGAILSSSVMGGDKAGLSSPNDA